jgi:hypothetical protein
MHTANALASHHQSFVNSTQNSFQIFILSPIKRQKMSDYNENVILWCGENEETMAWGVANETQTITKAQQRLCQAPVSVVRLFRFTQYHALAYLRVTSCAKH